MSATARSCEAFGTALTGQKLCDGSSLRGEKDCEDRKEAGISPVDIAPYRESFCPLLPISVFPSLEF